MSDDDFEKRIRLIAQQRAARIVSRRLYARQTKRKALRKARPAVRAVFWTTLVLTFLVLAHSVAGLVFGTP